MKTQTNIGAGFANESVDAFLSIAGIYLDSSERLIELTLAANRQALDDFVAQSRKRADTDAQSMPAEQFDATLMQPMIERAIGYSRSVMEVLMQTQVNAGKTLSQHLMSRSSSFPTSDAWTKAVDTMSEGVRAFSERSAAVAESQLRGTTEAVTKAAKAA